MLPCLLGNIGRMIDLSKTHEFAGVFLKTGFLLSANMQFENKSAFMDDQTNAAQAAPQLKKVFFQELVRAEVLDAEDARQLLSHV